VWTAVKSAVWTATTQLYNTFWDMVDKLDDYGFTVEYVMLDGATKAFAAMLFPGYFL
jgi:hypothetical protein